MQKAKRKSQSTASKRFFKVLLILIAIPVFTKLFCYGFSRFGGEFATANILSVHPESVYIGAVYSDGIDDYRIKESIYNSLIPADNLRTWFIDHQISLSPYKSIGYTDNGTKPYEYEVEFDGYYGTTYLFNKSNFLQEFHRFSAFLSGWFAEMQRSCQSVRVYYDLEVFKQDFPDIRDDNLITPYVIQTCWSNVE